MKAKTLALGGGLLLAASFVYEVVAEVYFDDCGLSEAQARHVVLDELARSGLDRKYLSNPESRKGSCSYSFYFTGQGRKLNYVVMSTWLHGVELNTWDYQRDEAENAKPSVERKSDSTAR